MRTKREPGRIRELRPGYRRVELGGEAEVQRGKETRGRVATAQQPTTRGSAADVDQREPKMGSSSQREGKEGLQTVSRAIHHSI